MNEVKNEVLLSENSFGVNIHFNLQSEGTS